jgi:hypothetical protein
LDLARQIAPSSSVVLLWQARLLIDHEQYDAACRLFDEQPQGGQGNLYWDGYRALARWGSGATPAPEGQDQWSIPLGGPELWGRWLMLIEERFPGGPGTDWLAPAGKPATLGSRIAHWRSARWEQRAARALSRQRYEQALSHLGRADLLCPGGVEREELRLQAQWKACQEGVDRLRDAVHDVDLRLATVEGLLDVGDGGEALRLLAPVEEHITNLGSHRLSWRANAALLQGRALLASDRPEEARPLLLEAQDLWPWEIEPVYYLAIACLRSGRRHQGRRALIEACQLDAALAQLRLDEYRSALAGPQ